MGHGNRIDHPGTLTLRDRLGALAALGVPSLAGIAYLALLGAPPAYPATNAAALALASLWIVFGRGPRSIRAQRVLAAALAVLLFVPLAAGPELHGVTRWLPLGPVTLHAGMLAIPALALLAARDPDYAPPLLLVGLLGAFLQPDAASGFALTFAAIGLHHITRDWKVGTVAIVGFIASIVMALNGELEPAPFVERILFDLALHHGAIALLLAAALVAGYLLTLYTLPAPRAVRFALAGSWFGFALMSVISNYPSLLIGYGAAPILGYGLAFGLANRNSP
ncbi:MAG: hypothetical protein IE933_10835 [Sphingomonadales bacterium]|nr:hypothetical protein [Sphingomonadales bacterium]MBD3773835.1 hypothetical protein [Paracoccaceae bacterium]